MGAYSYSFGGTSVSFSAKSPEIRPLFRETIRMLRAPLYWNSSIPLCIDCVALPSATQVASAWRAYRASMKDLRRRWARIATVFGGTSVPFSAKSPKIRPIFREMIRMLRAPYTGIPLFLSAATAYLCLQ